MSYDTTIVELLHPRAKSIRPGLPHAIAAREVNLARVMPAIRLESLLLVILLCGVFLSVSFYPLHHTDLWGHLALGRCASEGSAVSPLLVDNNLKAINTAWLSQRVLYLWFTATGSEGLQLAHALLAILSAALMVCATRRRGVSLAVAIAAAATAYVLMLPVLGVLRPQLFGLVAMPLVLWGVAMLDDGKRHPFAWLPLVMLLWANLHGSFTVGLAVLGCLAIARMCEARRNCGTWREVFQMNRAGAAVLSLLLATAACCVHPAGPALLWNAVAFGASTNLADISEWQPLTVKSLSGALFFASLLITAALLRYSPRKVRIYEVLLLVAMAVGTLAAIRMLVWWAMVWPWVVAPHVAAILESRRFAHAGERIAKPIYTLMATVAIMLTLVWSPPTYGLITSHERAETEVLTADTPVFLAKEVQRLALAGRAVVPMEWADYLAFQSEGRLQPLVHSHVHLIKPSVLGDYRHILAGHADWLDILDRHEVRYFVVRDLYEYSIAGQVLGNPRLRMIYRDQQGAILEVLPKAVVATDETHAAKHVKQSEQPHGASPASVQPTEQTGSQRDAAINAHEGS